MDQLCDDILLCVFSFIKNNRDMVNITEVCKRFICLMRTGYNLKSQTLCIKNISNESVMNLVNGWNELRNINCVNKQITDEFIRWLSKALTLQTVDFSRCYHLTDESARWLSKLSTLQSVNFYACCRLTNNTARWLSELSTLQSVNFRGCNLLTDESVRWISKCKNLQTVDFSFCDLLTDKSARWLSTN